MTESLWGGLPGLMKQIHSIFVLEQACKKAAQPDTAYGEYSPDRYGPLHAHCGAVAYTTQTLFGGNILSGKINHSTGERHLWNQLPDGLQVDVTASQYGLTILDVPTGGRQIKPRKTVNPRFAKFHARVLELLKDTEFSV